MIAKAALGAYTFPHDYIGEGYDAVFDRLEQAGLGSATVAVAYHTSRDVFPHNPLGMLQYLESGVTYFDPDPLRYPEPGPRPTEAVLTAGTDFLDRFFEAADDRGFATGAWVVALHNTRLGMAHPDLSCRTALGDRLLHSLCPANPLARAYVVGLAEDVAARGFRTLKLESVGYMGFTHGHHHERSFVDLSSLAVALLGICFCDHCMSAAAAEGADPERARADAEGMIRRELERSVIDDPDAVTHERLWSLADGEMGGVLRARTRVVGSLITAIDERVAAVAPGTSVRVIDGSGAELGYATGRPQTADPATSIGWRQGLDLDAIRRVCDLAVTGYFADPGRLERELESYRSALGQEAYERMELILRPMLPDVASAAELREKVRIAEAAGVNELAFYHYGLIRLESLDWIASALPSTPARTPGQDPHPRRARRASQASSRP